MICRLAPRQACTLAVVTPFLRTSMMTPDNLATRVHAIRHGSAGWTTAGPIDFGVSKDKWRPIRHHVIVPLCFGRRSSRNCKYILLVQTRAQREVELKMRDPRGRNNSRKRAGPSGPPSSHAQSDDFYFPYYFLCSNSVYLF